jgi:hypothetical protein
LDGLRKFGDRAFAGEISWVGWEVVVVGWSFFHMGEGLNNIKKLSVTGTVCSIKIE